MEASCTYADTTIVFGDVENPRIAILGVSMASVIVEQLEEGGSVAGEWDTRPPGTLSFISNANAVTRRRRNTGKMRHLTPPYPNQHQRTDSQPTAQKPPGERSWGFSGSLNTITMSPKTRDIVFPSNSTPARPPPPTPCFRMQPTAQKPPGERSWGFSGSLNTNLTSPKTRDVMFPSISTPTLPSPRTPAS
ncbi:hypothetical protein Moror_9188 [Moniliophthora roreri MCA 2997]|uniref:Uncharacterized protein n=1 Tax=Moniliophthora roreri (strain MCA 2997) TaxID=1381753 RepID=V2WJB4_MONRO|nr:hypothetical protein Moror_9188 [Moniliophthora roreri MCA 2997]